MTLCLSTTTFAIACLIIVSHSFPINNEGGGVALFLKKYGYIDEINGRNGAILTQEEMSKAIKDYQKFVGLKETGKLDSETLSKMNAARCGVKDKIEPSTSISEVDRKKRFAVQGSKWRLKHLAYRISKYPKRIKDKSVVDREIARAFKSWSDASPLYFREKKRGRVNIDIRFVTGYHGDHESFDGPGYTLAHAFFPDSGGQVHFDDQENWTIEGRDGHNLFLVAAHEIGHSLGINHSEDEEALMAPNYRYDPSLRLQNDDTVAIQSLYGQRNISSHLEIEDPPSDTRDAPDLCQDAQIDAATRTKDGSPYVFKGDYYWKLLDNAIVDGYPRRISDDWKGLEGNLDAAMTWANGKTFFFKGGRYWRFTDKNSDDGYPKLISVGFEGIPDNLDAAVVWGANKKTYFFKDDKYWRYDSSDDPPVSGMYPRPISNWKGLPDNLDAAMRWENGVTYFLKNDIYYRFDDESFEVSAGDPPYPRPTAPWWFGCKSN